MAYTQENDQKAFPHACQIADIFLWVQFKNKDIIWTYIYLDNVQIVLNLYWSFSKCLKLKEPAPPKKST